MNQLLQTEELNRYVRINIQTPMSFKYQSSYMIFLRLNVSLEVL